MSFSLYWVLAEWVLALNVPVSSAVAVEHNLQQKKFKNRKSEPTNSHACEPLRN